MYQPYSFSQQQQNPDVDSRSDVDKWILFDGNLGRNAFGDNLDRRCTITMIHMSRVTLVLDSPSSKNAVYYSNGHYGT
jgi:hypothetical protein